MLLGIQAMALGLMMIGIKKGAEGNDRNIGTVAKGELNCTILNVLCKYLHFHTLCYYLKQKEYPHTYAHI